MPTYMKYIYSAQTPVQLYCMSRTHGCTYIDSINVSTGVDCGTLPNPANGQVSHTTGTTFGQTATYNCNTGYNLVGDSTRTCQDTGQWGGSAPNCQRKLVL